MTETVEPLYVHGLSESGSPEVNARSPSPFAGVGTKPRQMAVLDDTAAAIPLVVANGGEHLATGRACPRRVRVDAAGG